MKLKKLKQKKILFVLLLAFTVLVVGVCIFLFANKFWLASDNIPIGRELIEQPTSPKIIDTSTIVYNAKTTIPNTGITFAYPKEGYYGMGAKIHTTEHFGSSLEGIESYTLVSTTSDGKQQVSVDVYDMGEMKTFDDVLTMYSLRMNDLSRGAPYIQTINGVDYLLNPPAYTYDLGYYATTVVNGYMLRITFNGGFDVNSKDTPAIIEDFISKLDFTCATDCSENSVPIVSVDKYRGGNDN